MLLTFTCESPSRVIPWRACVSSALLRNLRSHVLSVEDLHFLLIERACVVSRTWSLEPYLLGSNPNSTTSFGFRGGRISVLRFHSYKMLWFTYLFIAVLPM